MNPEKSRLREEEQTAAAPVTEARQQQTAREFATVEDLLRHDSEQNPVPENVAHRLNESLAAEPKAERSWFSKWFKRGPGEGS